MCYAKPGPRCSAHAKAILDAAIAKHGADSKEAREAREAFLRTPAGIKDLKARGEHELAYQYEQERQTAIEDSKAVEALLSELEELEGKEVNDDEIVTFENLSASRFDDGRLFVCATLGLTLDLEQWQREILGTEYFTVDQFSGEDWMDAIREWIADSEDLMEWDIWECDAEETLINTLTQKTGLSREVVERNLSTYVEASPEVRHFDTVESTNFYREYLEELDVDYLDEDELEVLKRHPLATDEKRKEAKKRYKKVSKRGW